MKIIKLKLLLIAIIAMAGSLKAQLNKEQQDQINKYARQIDNYKSSHQLKEASAYLNKTASIYLKAGEYQNAIDAYIQSSQLNEKINNDTDNKKIYNNIAMIYSEMGQLKNSLKYFEKSLAISRRNNNKEEIAVSLMDISTILIYNKQYSEAIKYLEEALKLSNDQDNLNSLITCYNLLSKCYRESGNQKKADEYYQKYTAMDKLRREGKTSLANKSDNFTAAESENLNKEIKPKETNDLTNVINSDLPKTYFITRDNKANDSLTQQLKQSQDKAANLEMEVLNIDKELKELKETRLISLEKKQERSNFIIIFLAVFLSILIFLLAYSFYLIRKRESQIGQLKQKIAELKKDKLRI